MTEAGAASPPSAHYRAGVERGDWSDDPTQLDALQALDRIHAALLQAAPRRSLLDRLRGQGAAEAPQGLYLWGRVGRGKTFLVDLFYATLPLPEVRGAALASGALPQPAQARGPAGKRRTHFHRFMRSVHALLRAHAGERDPLATIVREWRRQMRVL